MRLSKFRHLLAVLEDSLDEDCDPEVVFLYGDNRLALDHAFVETTVEVDISWWGKLTAPSVATGDLLIFMEPECGQ